MQLGDAVPRMLSQHATKRWRRARRILTAMLRVVGAFLFLVAGIPMGLGRLLMWAGGRANGAAYIVGRDR